MIPVILKKKSSNRRPAKPFNRLITYVVANENLDSLAANNPKQKFTQLLNYVTDQHDLNSGLDKCVAVRCHGITDIRFAAVEMNAVALQNTRCNSPVLHIVLSWHEEELVTNESTFEAAQHVLKKLGLEEHQYILGIHADTDNRHCHIVVSRIHPVTFKSKNIEWANRSLHMAARECEIMHGWIHDNGIYIVEVDGHGRKSIVLNPEHDHNLPRKNKNKEMPLPTWTDPDSLKSWLKLSIGPALKQAIPSLNSWNDLHSWLDSHRLTLSDAGGGGLRIAAISLETDATLNIAASKVMRMLSREALELRWGKFSGKSVLVDSHVEIHVSELPLIAKRAHEFTDVISRGGATVDSEVNRRDERKAQRAAARLDLRRRYAQYCRSAQASSTNHAMSIKQLKKIHADFLKELRALKKKSIKALRSIEDIQVRFLEVVEIEAKFIQNKAQLDINYRQQYSALSATRTPPLSWRIWLTAQAKLGDQAALSALRGIVYQAQRDAKRSGAEEIVSVEIESNAGPRRSRDMHHNQVISCLSNDELLELAIRPARRDFMRPYQADALLVSYTGIRWEVTGNGNVNYSEVGGSHLFTDRGNRITFDRELVSDHDICLALIHGEQKFGNQITLTGSDPAFVTRMALLADDLGLNVLNPDLCDIIAQHRAERDLQIESTKLSSEVPNIENPEVITLQPLEPSSDHDQGNDSLSQSDIYMQDPFSTHPLGSVALSNNLLHPNDPVTQSDKGFSADSIANNISATSPSLSAKDWAMKLSKERNVPVVQARPGHPKVAFTILYIAEDGVVVSLGRSAAVYPVPDDLQIRVGAKIAVGAAGNLCALVEAGNHRNGRSR